MDKENKRMVRIKEEEENKLICPNFDGRYCADCALTFYDKDEHRRSKYMPFLCETCAEYRKGGY